jgi:preprotein translocase subunit YajC
MNEVFAQTAECAAPAGAASGGFGTLLPIVIIWGAILYLFFIRPQKKKDKERKNLLDNLKKKDEIITVGGIMGKVEGIIDNVVSIKVADNTVIKVQRSAISRIVTDDDPAEESNSCVFGCSK